MSVVDLWHVLRLRRECLVLLIHNVLIGFTCVHVGDYGLAPLALILIREHRKFGLIEVILPVLTVRCLDLPLVLPVDQGIRVYRGLTALD